MGRVPGCKPLASDILVMQDVNSEVLHFVWEPGEGEGMLVGGLGVGVGYGDLGFCGGRRLKEEGYE